MGIKKGTILTDSPKDKTIKIRIDKETSEKLDFLSKKKQKSKSEIVRKGISIQYDKEV